jgi:Xaa-Pro aminopeptidase
MPKPPITPDDIDALSKAWNESKAATDAVLAKFREGASKDEIDDAIQAAEQTSQCFGLAPLLDARADF